jgi:HPt (histidine-containing phosphotransfer) domain-containing protein
MSYTNLEYLREAAEGDKQIIREMIEMFLSHIPEFNQNLNDLFRKGQYSALGSEAHKIKSSIQILGMHESAVEMDALQTKTRQNIDPESYPVHIGNFERQCEAAIIELRAELESM